MARPFRFSVTSSTTEPAAFVEQARRAEDLGYSTLSLSDHLDAQFAPLVALAAAAQVTSSLRLATVVLNNDFRHPALLAKEAATVDQLSAGRLELGIGAGWMQADYDAAGIAFDRAGTRIARLAEAITIIKAAFGTTPATFSGEHYTVDALQLVPRPIQQPRPPIMIAGGGPKILGLAAREADIVGLNPALGAGVMNHRAGPSATSDATDQKLDWIREAAGARFAALELHTRVHLASIENDPLGLAAAVAPALGMEPADALESPHALVGSVEQCVETLHARRERWGISYVGFSGDAMHAMAPVVARLAGQ